MKPDLRREAARIVAETTRQQGRPRHVTDPEALRRLAILFLPRPDEQGKAETTGPGL